MDSALTPSVDELIAYADNQFEEGNYKDVIKELEPLLDERNKRKEMLSPREEWEVRAAVSASYRFLDEPKAALPHIR